MPSSSTRHAARVPVGGERLGLPARAVQREHELAAQALPQRMLGDEGLELADHVLGPAERDVGVDPVRDAGEPEVLETGDLGLGEELASHVGEGGASPDRERSAQRLDRRRRSSPASSVCPRRRSSSKRSASSAPSSSRIA